MIPQTRQNTTYHRYSDSVLFLFFSENLQKWSFGYEIKYGGNKASYCGFEVENKNLLVNLAEKDMQAAIIELIDDLPQDSDPDDLKDLEAVLSAVEWSGITCLDDFTRSSYFETWHDSNCGNDMWTEDPKRKQRIEDAAELGCIGSTHEEIIQDERDCLKCFANDNLTLGTDDPIYLKIEQKIQEVEDWHRENGSLETEVG